MATVSVTASARAQTYNPKYPICLKVIQKFGVMPAISAKV
jgi:hypothetical protein